MYRGSSGRLESLTIQVLSHRHKEFCFSLLVCQSLRLFQMPFGLCIFWIDAYRLFEIFNRLLALAKDSSGTASIVVGLAFSGLRRVAILTRGAR